jgi:hypothetical protein
MDELLTAAIYPQMALELLALLDRDVPSASLGLRLLALLLLAAALDLHVLARNATSSNPSALTASEERHLAAALDLHALALDLVVLLLDAALLRIAGEFVLREDDLPLALDLVVLLLVPALDLHGRELLALL